MKKKIPTTRQNQLFTNPEIFDKNFLAKVYKKQNDQAKFSFYKCFFDQKKNVDQKNTFLG